MVWGFRLQMWKDAWLKVCCDSTTYRKDIFFYLLTHSTAQSPSWEANWFAASQEIPRISRNPKVHHRTHKSPPPVSIQSVSLGPRLSVWRFRNMIRFYGEEFSAPRPTPKMEDHPLSAVRDCNFNIFSATLHTGGRSSTRKLRTRRAVVTGTHVSRKHAIRLRPHRKQ